MEGGNNEAAADVQDDGLLLAPPQGKEFVKVRSRGLQLSRFHQPPPPSSGSPRDLGRGGRDLLCQTRCEVRYRSSSLGRQGKARQGRVGGGKEEEGGTGQISISSPFFLTTLTPLPPPPWIQALPLTEFLPELHGG